MSRTFGLDVLECPKRKGRAFSRLLVSSGGQYPFDTDQPPLASESPTFAPPRWSLTRNRVAPDWAVRIKSKNGLHCARALVRSDHRDALLGLLPCRMLAGLAGRVGRAETRARRVRSSHDG